MLRINVVCDVCFLHLWPAHRPVLHVRFVCVCVLLHVRLPPPHAALASSVQAKIVWRDTQKTCFQQGVWYASVYFGTAQFLQAQIPSSNCSNDLFRFTFEYSFHCLCTFRQPSYPFWQVKHKQKNHDGLYRIAWWKQVLSPSAQTPVLSASAPWSRCGNPSKDKTTVPPVV